MTMRNLGEFKLRETENSELFYVTVMGTSVFATTEFPTYASVVGKIKVYHDGLYFGTPDDMYGWIEGEILDYLKKQEMIVQDGETPFGDKIWRWGGHYFCWCGKKLEFSEYDPTLKKSWLSCPDFMDTTVEDCDEHDSIRVDHDCR